VKRRLDYFNLKRNMHDPHNNIIDSRVFKEHYIDLGNENQQVFKK